MPDLERQVVSRPNSQSNVHPKESSYATEGHVLVVWATLSCIDAVIVLGPTEWGKEIPFLLSDERLGFQEARCNAAYRRVFCVKLDKR